MQNYEELTLQSDTFEVIREDFNLLLQKLFKKMEVSQSDEGSIDLKINIEMKEDFIPQDDGSTKKISKPTLKHKISTVVPVKDSTDGTKDTGMELVYDADLKRYVLRYVSTGGQMSIFDVQEEQEESAEVVEETAAIEQGGGYFLPDNGSDSAEEENIGTKEENGATDDTDTQEPLPFSEDGEDGEGGFPDDYGYDEPQEG